ncbi:phosphoglycerate mutase family protein [Microbacterium esteraromaticum]|uniref:histidine phosphatase family protein n=1 Tax=Microbacterium esteraromaticum TaxID=57043 RepID=UPI00236809BA|nr:histidine phosphatase family protein [Microbacterium esteraromaticum]WDH79057.1 phosphoglycerate mutase family protein [Microbacterium esteraromaticum]
MIRAMNSQHGAQTITFVRHALPEVDPQAQPSEWALTQAGVEAATALKLARSAQFVSSPELKALQTVALATGLSEDAVLIDPAFREVDRIENVHDGYRAARRAWVSGELDRRHDGWESLESAAHRLSDGLRRYDAPHVIVGTHGMVLTAWLVSAGVVMPGGSAVAFWEQLPFPAVVTVGVRVSGRVSLTS